MTIRAHPHAEMEFLRWLALMILALSLAMLVVSRTAGQIPLGPEPGLLPGELDAWAASLKYSEELPPSHQTGLNSEGPQDTEDPLIATLKMWHVIDLLHDQQYVDAGELLRTFRLPPQTDSFRAVTAAYCQLKLDAVDDSLWEFSPGHYLDENPLVHFVTGLAMVRQIDGDRMLQLDSNPGFWTQIEQQGWLVGKDFYLLVAATHLQAGVDLAPGLDPHLPLMLQRWVISEPHNMSMPTASPTVGDLITVMEMEEFVLDTHYILGRVELARGNWAAAESNLDATDGREGQTTLAYLKIAQQYVELEQIDDANRAAQKAATVAVRALSDYLNSRIESLYQKGEFTEI